MKKRDIYLSMGLIGIFILWLFFVLAPIYNDSDFKTITKISQIYDEPIFVIFNWITADEIQVGKLITLNLEIQGLPYTQNMTLNNIEIKFDEKQINYWVDDKAETKSIIDNEAKRQIQFPEKDQVQLKPDWESTTFNSESFNLRFITPEDISIQYCDYNLEMPCHNISKIIHPAPYDLANRIDSNRIVITLSLLTASLSTIVVWSRLRDTLKK